MSEKMLREDHLPSWRYVDALRDRCNTLVEILDAVCPLLILAAHEARKHGDYEAAKRYSNTLEVIRNSGETKW